MSIQSTVARIDAIRQAIADPAELIGTPASAARAGGTEAPAGGSFATALAQAGASQDAAALESPYGETGTGLPEAGQGGLSGLSGLSGAYGYGPPTAGGGSYGERMVAAAESQLGQSEQPPGSNESPAIAMYREATAGAEPGAPWCAYFASWAARQAGEPIGAGGEGLGSVGEIWSWAQSTGRAVANGPGVVPQPGDLIVFGDEHVGIVRGVLPDGRIATIEGNYENKVAANVRSATEATGYVRMS